VTSLAARDGLRLNLSGIAGSRSALAGMRAGLD
jgi:hypothetical protein